jgi:phage replication O-like protein O
MMQENYTKTPNIIFDQLLRELNNSELKILLVIVRQTYGWRDSKSKEYKKRDRITYNQFISKTGISRRIISIAINSLFKKNLILITNTTGNVLDVPKDRKGRYFIYYSPLLKPVHSQSTCAKNDTNMCKNRHEHVQKVIHNKRNYNKRNLSKERGPSYKQIGEVIEVVKSKWKHKIKE